MRALVVGENFRFGAGAHGDAALARARSSAGAGREVESRVPPLARSAASASRARASAPRSRAATSRRPTRCWARRTRCAGASCSARAAGTTSGFPTANLAVAAGEDAAAATASTRAVARYDGRDYPGLVSIGDNPTFGGGENGRSRPGCATFGGTIYGEELALRDFRFVREQRAFRYGRRAARADAGGCDARGVSLVSYRHEESR